MIQGGFDSYSCMRHRNRSARKTERIAVFYTQYHEINTRRLRTLPLLLDGWWGESRDQSCFAWLLAGFKFSIWRLLTNENRLSGQCMILYPWGRSVVSREVRDWAGEGLRSCRFFVVIIRPRIDSIGIGSFVYDITSHQQPAYDRARRPATPRLMQRVVPDMNHTP
ncbi:hypothetical protein PM082_000245 [Marasmius tenuissimus]|nr:hypothetical protein PM082_000245 [Marasmius tenuissimus]